MSTWREAAHGLAGACLSGRLLTRRRRRHRAVNSAPAPSTRRSGDPRLLQAHPSRHVVLFTGHGATHALNLLADALFPNEVRLLLRGARTHDSALRGLYGEMRSWAQGRGVEAADLLRRDLVVVSRMEHHSNMLPWMRAEEAMLDHVEGSGCGTLPGMVRASAGIYTTGDDLLALEEGVRWVKANADRIAGCYATGPSGELVHRSFACPEGFGIRGEVEGYFGGV